MRLEWKSFGVCLPSLNDFLSANSPNSDGLVCGTTGCYVIEKNPLTQNEIDAINSYWGSLNQAGEAQKATNFATARDASKKAMLKAFLEDLLGDNS